MLNSSNSNSRRDSPKTAASPNHPPSRSHHSTISSRMVKIGAMSHRSSHVPLPLSDPFSAEFRFVLGFLSATHIFICILSALGVWRFGCESNARAEPILHPFCVIVCGGGEATDERDDRRHGLALPDLAWGRCPQPRVVWTYNALWTVRTRGYLQCGVGFRAGFVKRSRSSAGVRGSAYSSNSVPR